MQLPLSKILKDGTFVELDIMRPQEESMVRALLNAVILEGRTYPQVSPLGEKEFAAYWLVSQAFVVRTADEILGAFYVKPNFPGRCRHIANAGFIVPPHVRRKGIGRFMGESMLLLARQEGFEAIMFNLVFETNVASIHLWKSLGFEVIGKIPRAVKFADGSVIDALTMHRKL
ncbi:MAG: GNAT family N-acetyltransferase [Gloeobacterales cyanobacterium]